MVPNTKGSHVFDTGEPVGGVGKEVLKIERREQAQKKVKAEEKKTRAAANGLIVLSRKEQQKLQQERKQMAATKEPIAEGPAQAERVPSPAIQVLGDRGVAHAVAEPSVTQEMEEGAHTQDDDANSTEPSGLDPDNVDGSWEFIEEDANMPVENATGTEPNQDNLDDPDDSWDEIETGSAETSEGEYAPTPTIVASAPSTLRIRAWWRR